MKNKLSKEQIINNFREEFNFSDSEKIELIGYVIFSPKKEEFVCLFNKGDDSVLVGYESTLIGYSVDIGNALIYKNHSQAIAHAKNIDKYDIDVCALLETEKSLGTHPIWSNYN